MFNGASEGLIFSTSAGPTTSWYSPTPLVVWDNALTQIIHVDKFMSSISSCQP